MTPTFLATLVKWLQATKGDPKYSRKLANFVRAQSACNVFELTYTESAPSYHRNIKPAPEGRYNSRVLRLSDQEIYYPEEGYYRGVDFRDALCEGGSAGVYTRRVMPGTPAGAVLAKNITIPFWERYMQIGVCLFDPDHIDFGGVRPLFERYRILDPQTVQCNWCGEVLHLRRTLDIDVRVRSSWTSDPVTSDGQDTFRCRRCHRRHPISDVYQCLHGVDRSNPKEEIPIPSEGLCMSCFLAETMAKPYQRHSLMPNPAIGMMPSVSLD